MQYEQWKTQARQHWKEHRPQMFKHLQEGSQLQKALTRAVEQTAADLEELQAEGMNWHQAWEMVRERYLFLPPEQSKRAEPMGSQGYPAMREMQRLRRNLAEASD
jgi:hypothetical protein